MTARELQEYFKEHLVPEKIYKIGGTHKNRICLEKNGAGWDLFFAEKKQRIGLVHYADEASACVGMKNEIRKVMESVYGLTWAVTAG